MGKKSQLEVSTNNDTHGVVSKEEIQKETHAVSDEDKEENYNY